MKDILISCILLILFSSTRPDGESDYLGSDSADWNAEYEDILYGDQKSPLNLAGTLRQRLALNGAIAVPGESFVCSPISALMPLGKLILGASGECKKQLGNAIGALTSIEVKKSFKSLLHELKSVRGVTLSVCSRIYVSKEYYLRADYARLAKEIFQTSLVRVNILKPDKVARMINHWVSEKTLGLIPEIIKPNSISPSSSVILVNAVYFSGTWKNTFRRVKETNFYTGIDIRRVNMMTREGKYKYSKRDALDCQIIEIPYTEEEASFVIFLPNTRDGLPLLLYKLKLAPELMQSAMNSMQTHHVILSIPKFKTETELDLKVAYEKLGLTQIIKTENSGLDQIVEGDGNLYVSKAVQKAYIEISENGTRAAAASAIEIIPLSLILNRKKFKANRPFYYIIKAKKEIIFSGVYTGDSSFHDTDPIDGK